MTDTDELDELEQPRDHRAKDTIDLYELPAIFTKDGTDNAPTTRPIVYAYVWKKQGAALGFIDWLPIEEMQDLDQLRDRYGAGIYQVQGRAVNRKDNVKQVTVTIGGAIGGPMLPTAARAELDIAKLGGAIVAVATPVLGLLKEMWDRADERRRQDRADEARRRDDERARDDARNTAFMTTMTNLMSARNADLEQMVQARSKGGQGGSTAEAFADGQASTLELIRAVKEEGLGGEDAETKLFSLIEAFAVGKKKADDEIATAANGGKA